MFAVKNMCIQQTNGEILKFDVEEVEEVYYVKQNSSNDSLAVDASEVPLKFNILSDSTAEVIKDFSYCDLESVTVPSAVRIDGDVYSVTTIADYAFSGFTSLTNIKISSSVTKIGDSAFADCKKLDVAIDNSKAKIKIGTDAFLGCKSVKYSR